MSELAVAILPLSIGIAIVRHGLFDSDLVINRVAVLALLTAAGVGAYILTVAVVGWWLGANNLAPVVAAVVGLGAASLRTRFQRRVDRWLFGARHDPFTVVHEVGASVAGAPGAAGALDRLCCTLR